MNERNEEYWWLVGAAWLFGVVALVIVLNVVRVHLLNRSTPAIATTTPPPPVSTPAPVNILPSATQQSIFSEPAGNPSVLPAAKPQAEVAPPPPAAVPKKLHPVSQGNVRDVTDEQIGTSLKRGVDFLLKQFSGAKLKNDVGVDPDTYQGLNALCIYALLHAGQAINDPRLNVQNERMKNLLDRLKEYPMDGGKATYSKSLRISALAVYNRPEDRTTIASDANWLMRSSMKGAYTYSMPPPGATGGWDHSNSQYGVLGMWAAADAGISIPLNYWAEVEQHWISTQGPTGGWDYQGGGNGTLTMTAAGVTTLFIARDQQAIDSPAGKLGLPLSKALSLGLEWLDEGDHSVANLGGFPGYARYGLERAGLASGYKYFGEHDWYLTAAKQIVGSQQDDGSWNGGIGPAGETAFNLLLLARGRQPVFMSKLRLGDGWGAHPRDVANLTHFASHELERPLNWQIATLDRDWMDWSDSAVLYVAGDKAVALKDSDIEKIRGFVEAGGLLFTHANNGSATFNLFVANLAKKLFPDYPMQDLEEDHFVYSVMFPLKNKPVLKAVGNGARLLMVHSPTDLGRQWMARTLDKKMRPASELGVNIAVYAAGKRNLRNRVDSLYIREPTGKPIGTLAVARLKYKGTWDPEPGAWRRMGKKFEWETSIHPDVNPVEIADLKFETTPLAVLTGTGILKLEDGEIKTIGQFVKAGGMLFVDDCGGAGQFGPSAREMLEKALPEGTLEPLPADHEILAARLMGMENLGKPKYRLYVTEQGSSPPAMQAMQVGNGQVIFSSLDITSGLLGTGTWGIMGYDPDYAQAFVKNMMLAAAGVEEKPKTKEEK